MYHGQLHRNLNTTQGMAHDLCTCEHLYCVLESDYYSPPFKIFYSNALLKLFTFNLVYLVIYIFRNLIYLSIYINACCITVFIPFTFLAIYCLNFNSCIYFSILALCITYPNKLTYTIKYEYNFLLLVGIENIY